jgi:hypothetical protein
MNEFDVIDKMDVKDMYQALVSSPGWKDWLYNRVVPHMNGRRAPLLQNEKLPEIDRVASIQVMKALKELIFFAYRAANEPLPKPFENLTS